ncbi:hypothetical protein V6N13_088643 [Hibiscus sabdariffa]|uniref:Uncharacterized protein n=1 Tax=Hibiscus sabdariffa TaxID=183260 RepID=A0ABR2G0W6_9ROSI
MVYEKIAENITPAIFLQINAEVSKCFYKNAIPNSTLEPIVRKNSKVAITYCQSVVGPGLQVPTPLSSASQNSKIVFITHDLSKVAIWSFAKTSSLFPLRFPRKRDALTKVSKWLFPSLVTQNVE